MRNGVWLRSALLALALCVFGSGYVRADIRLDVDVSDRTSSTVAVVYQTTIVEIPLDDKGHGSHVFTHLEAVHARLFYGMEFKHIFLEDGDRIHVTFDGNNFKETVKYEVAGGKEKIFNYLNQVSLLEFPEEKMALPFGEFTDFVDKKEATMLRTLKAWKLEGISPRFVEIEKGRIHYAYASSKLMYAVGHPFVAQDSAYVPGEDYYDVIRGNAVPKEELVGLREYREYMKEAARIFGCRKEDMKTPYDRTVCMMNYIADHIDNDKVRQTLLNVLAIEQVEQYGIAGIEELMNLHATFVTDSVLRMQFKEKYDAWDLTRPGNPSPDFRAWDMDGKDWHVADFKGKYVYIDLWATWCAPCRREIPFLRKLEEEYKGRNIVFVSLATDARKADWAKVVKEQSMTGIQLFLGKGSRFQTAYKADGIPHFILLDPEGKVVNANMLRPSSPDVRAYLDRQAGL